MPSFLIAVVIAIVLAVGAAVVLDGYYQQTVTTAFTSPTGVRI